MKTPIIWPYKIASASAKSLANALNTKRVRSDGHYQPRNNHVIINWGNSHLPDWLPPSRTAVVLNSVDRVSVAANKLSSFLAFREADVTIPEFTTELGIASQWALEGTVVGRSLLRASGGRGITLYGPDSPPNASGDLLWVKYIKKAAEYRIHVFNGVVIHEQQKRKERGFEQRNNQIRSRQNGWIFATQDIQPDSRRNVAAIAAVNALGLQYAAVDLIYNQNRDQYYVLECNTAPGLEGTTIEKYAGAIRAYCEAAS